MSKDVLSPNVLSALTNNQHLLNALVTDLVKWRWELLNDMLRVPDEAGTNKLRGAVGAVDDLVERLQSRLPPPRPQSS